MWKEILKVLESRLAHYGFDFIHPFDVQVYNNHPKIMHNSRLKSLPTFGKRSTFGLLVASSKTIWPRFLDHCVRNPSWSSRRHPFDDYVVHSIHTCLEESLRKDDPLNPVTYETRFPFQYGMHDT